MFRTLLRKHLPSPLDLSDTAVMGIFDSTPRTMPAGEKGMETDQAANDCLAASPGAEARGAPPLSHPQMDTVSTMESQASYLPSDNLAKMAPQEGPADDTLSFGPWGKAAIQTAKRHVLIDGDTVSPAMAQHILRPDDIVSVATNDACKAPQWQENDAINVWSIDVEVVPTMPQAADMALSFMAGRVAGLLMSDPSMIASSEWLVLARDRDFLLLRSMLSPYGISMTQLDVSVVAPRPAAEKASASKHKTVKKTAAKASAQPAQPAAMTTAAPATTPQGKPANPKPSSPAKCDTAIHAERVAAKNALEHFLKVHGLKANAKVHSVSLAKWLAAKGGKGNKLPPSVKKLPYTKQKEFQSWIGRMPFKRKGEHIALPLLTEGDRQYAGRSAR